MQKIFFKINWDAVGVTASVACAIHCALMPLILTSLPLFGIDIINNSAFEFFMIGISFFVGVIALYHGRKHHHHSKLPVILFSLGIAFLFAKQIWHHYFLLFLIPAVILIVSAHYINFRLCRKADNCNNKDCNH